MPKTELEQLKKIAEKGSLLEKTGVLGMAKSMLEIEDKVDSVNENIDSKLSDVAKAIRDIPKSEAPEVVKIELAGISIVSIKGDKGDTPKVGIDFEQPENGKDYILTDKDKKEIARSINVPIVEKIIEKTETIVEKPIVTNEIKEVAVTDKAEKIVEKINELPTDNEDLKIDASHIKNLPKINGGNYFGGSGIKEVIAGTGITVDNSRLGYPVVSATAGSGGITRSISSISSPTTAGATASTDYVYLVSGTTTLTLPTAVGNTNRYTVKNVGSGDVTIDTTSAQTIDGGATAILTANLQGSIDLISDNSNWFVC